MLRFVVVIAVAATCAFAAPAQEQPMSLVDQAIDIYHSCASEDLTVCLKLRALGFVDRVARSAEINLVDGLKIVKNEEGKKLSREDGARSLNDIEASLPTEVEAREAAVDEALYDRAARFLSTHTVELSMPEEVSRSLGEARKKKKIVKTLIPFLLLLKLKAAVLVPILLGGLALLAFKALIVGKIALIISAVLALQKLFAGKGGQSYEFFGHDAGHHHDEHHGSGWGRAIGSELAYNAHKPESN